MNVIGMISGTSFDAIEAVAINFSIVDHTIDADMLGHVSIPYDDDLRQRVARVLPPHPTTIEEVCQLDTIIGQSFADVAASVADDFFDGEADVVCSHGQTVYHWVNEGHALGTLQIGQGAWIAERTGATVVSDVRSRDVAAGGHGAPLASLLDVLLLGKNPMNVRGALNLGGISNITVVGPTQQPVAFDIGPANALMDAAVTWMSGGGEHYDHNGVRGARGVVDEGLLTQLLADPYYAAPAPKSTGKEHFHLEYLLNELSSRSIEDDDLIATLSDLTARTVADAVRAYGVKELFVSGGGTRNPHLMRLIESYLRDVKVSLVDDFGVPEAAKEAALFALIGFLTVHGIDASVASCTGARHASVLGAIIPGRQPIMSVPEQFTPTSLTFRSGSHREAKSD
ncbi:MAG: anhydro-N-acetylmuramic acid kinase [Acidimicrobiales bacterium]